MERLNVGDDAPLFELMTGSGEAVRLADHVGKTSVVLFFYPKDDTPGCTREACDFRDMNDEFKAVGAVVYGLSKDSVSSHAKFAEKFTLSFPLLSDPDGSVCQSYRVWVEKLNYGKKYMGIERTTFVIASSGKITHVYTKAKVDGHVAAVLSDIKSMA